MTQPDVPATSPPLALAAHAIRRLVIANPLLGLAVERVAKDLDAAEHAPEQLSLADRFGMGRVLQEAAHVSEDPELLPLARAIMEDVLSIGATHAAEAAMLLQDVEDPERSVRYLRLLKSCLEACPAPSPAPVDPALAAGMRESLRTILLMRYPHAAGE